MFSLCEMSLRRNKNWIISLLLYFHVQHFQVSTVKSKKYIHVAGNDDAYFFSVSMLLMSLQYSSAVWKWNIRTKRAICFILHQLLLFITLAVWIFCFTKQTFLFASLLCVVVDYFAGWEWKMYGYSGSEFNDVTAQVFMLCVLNLI